MTLRVVLAVWLAAAPLAHAIDVAFEWVGAPARDAQVSFWALPQHADAGVTPLHTAVVPAGEGLRVPEDGFLHTVLRVDADGARSALIDTDRLLWGSEPIRIPVRASSNVRVVLPDGLRLDDLQVEVSGLSECEWYRPDTGSESELVVLSGTHVELTHARIFTTYLSAGAPRYVLDVPSRPGTVIYGTVNVPYAEVWAMRSTPSARLGGAAVLDLRGVEALAEWTSTQPVRWPWPR